MISCPGVLYQLSISTSYFPATPAHSPLFALWLIFQHTSEHFRDFSCFCLRVKSCLVSLSRGGVDRTDALLGFFGVWGRWTVRLGNLLGLKTHWWAKNADVLWANVVAFLKDLKAVCKVDLFISSFFNKPAWLIASDCCVRTIAIILKLSICNPKVNIKRFF